MTKEPQKTNDDVIAKVKAEAAEKERIKKEQEKDDPSLKDAPELTGAAKKEADRIAAAERDADDTPITEDAPATKDADTAGPAVEFGSGAAADNEKKLAKAQAKGQSAYKKLQLIGMSYPRTTPDEHTIFGFGGHRYTLGDLRDLLNLRD